MIKNKWVNKILVCYIPNKNIALKHICLGEKQGKNKFKKKQLINPFGIYHDSTNPRLDMIPDLEI